MPTTLHAIAIANPRFKQSQTQAAYFMSQVESLSPALRRRIPSIYASSAIERRYSCISDYGTEAAETFHFYPSTWTLQPFPTTAARNRAYAIHAPDLAIEVVRQCLAQSHYVAQDITHLIVVSCTGFSAPGVDIQIIQQVGLSERVARTLIGFMGCHGALNGLKVADGICRADAQARVLMVCVELCTLHFQIEDSIESAVTNALFSDGAAAVILSAEPAIHSGHGLTCGLTYCGGDSVVLPDSQALMDWTIGDTGFLMGLSPQVPDRIGVEISSYVDRVLEPHGLLQSDIDFWAIHPGGVQIVRQIQTSLNLSQSQLQDSYDVLRDYGNMSSPTILFILKQMLDGLAQTLKQTPKLAKPQRGVAMAFGPGLTIESALFEVS